MPFPFLTTPYFEPWLQFKQPCVRQLAFSLASPDMIRSLPPDLAVKHHFNLHSAHFWFDQYHAYLPRLSQLDQNPEPLLDFLHRLKSTRLGLRFEYLIWFWLQDHSYHPYQLLGHSIQNIQGARTLGELDFLLLNTATNEIEHWEVALKYYLGESDLSLPFWFGLNRDDTLYKKLNHFTQQQFQFKQIGEYVIQKRYAVLKGQLYVPDSLNEQLEHLDWIQPQRRLGTWGTHLKKGFYRLSRQEWLCPHLTSSSEPAAWWSNGLYFKPKNPVEYYMYRQHLLTYK